MGAFIKTLLHTICTMTQILFNRRGALLLIIINIFIISPRQSHASVIFSTILLMDSSSFSAKAFSSLVLTLTNATSITLHSVESDTITGVQGKSLFFFAPSSSLFYNFQLLHVTRARSSIEVEDEKTASAIIRLSLPHEALIRKSLTVGIESVEIGEADVVTTWLTTTYLELPPFAAQYLVVGWALTVLGFLACVVCYCCCCKKGADDGNNVQTIASVVMHPPAAAVPVQQQKPSIPSLVQPSAPPKIPSAPPQTVVGPTVKTSTAATAATTPPVPPALGKPITTTTTTTAPTTPLSIPGKPTAVTTPPPLPSAPSTKKPETDRPAAVQVDSKYAIASDTKKPPNLTPRLPPPMLPHRKSFNSISQTQMDTIRNRINNFRGGGT